MLWCMRTNIVLNDQLVQEAMHFSAATSKRALVEEALQTFVRVKAKEQQDAEYWQRVEQLQRRFAEASLRVSSHDLVRADRDR